MQTSAAMTETGKRSGSHDGPLDHGRKGLSATTPSITALVAAKTGSSGRVTPSDQIVEPTISPHVSSSARPSATWPDSERGLCRTSISDSAPANLFTTA